MKNYILKDENAVLFECGYSCDNVYFASLNGEKFFITDGRYGVEVRAKIAEYCLQNELNFCANLDEKSNFNQTFSNIHVVESSDLIGDLRKLIRKSKVDEIYFNPSEFSHYEFEKISTFLGVNFKQILGFSHKKRIVKTQREIEILRMAAKFGAQKFDEFAKFINEKGEGLSEKELFFNAENIFKDSGNLGLSFAPIVAINENAAKAHALPSKKRLQSGDLLLLDAGVKFMGFCSDRTRTAYFGADGLNFSKKQRFKSAKQNEIYEIVREAQLLAIRAVAPGVKARDIDAAARKFIAKFGYEKQFFHSTGHGVGLDIHELPYISARSDFIVREGMVFSIEPGIYFENEFGVRIEDVVVVTQNGCEILSE